MEKYPESFGIFYTWGKREVDGGSKIPQCNVYISVFGLFVTSMNIEHAHKSLILINGHNNGCDVNQRININDIYFRTLPLQTHAHEQFHNLFTNK